MIAGALVSAVLVIAGVAMWFSAPEMAVAFEGFSYEPLEGSSVVDSLFLSQQHVWAAFLVAGGLVAAGVTVGFLWGRV